MWQTCDLIPESNDLHHPGAREDIRECLTQSQCQQTRNTLLLIDMFIYE